MTETMEKVRFKNKLLERVVGMCARYNGWEPNEPKGRRSHFYANSFGGAPSGHGSCYGQIPSWRTEDWIYFPPAYNAEYGTMDLRIWYAKQVYFHPESPWKDVIGFLHEMFEGYETDDEKAELIARYGFIVTLKARQSMPMSHWGAFLIFWRKAHEMPLIRETFKYMMETNPHSDRPYRWNLIMSTFTTRSSDGRVAHNPDWSGGHHMLQPSTHHLGILGFMKNELMDLEGHNYWEGYLNGLWSKDIKGPGAWSMPQAKYLDPSGWDILPKWRVFDTLIDWYWNERVAKYV